MPPAIPAIIATASAVGVAGGVAAFGFAGLAGWAAAGAFFATNVALGLVAQALSPKPKSLGAVTAQLQDNTQTVREAVGSRKLVYGRTRVGGNIVYLESTGDDNKYLHMVVALASHEVDGLEEVYFDDTLVYNTSGYQDNWGDHARIIFHDGSQTTADSTLVSESSHWTSSHVLNDIAYLYVRLTYDRDQYANGIPNITAKIRGRKVYDPRTGTTAWSQNPALCIRDYMKDSKYGMGVTDSELNEASWIAAANLCEENVDLVGGGSQDRYTLDGVVNTANSRKQIIEDLLTSMAGSIVFSGGEFYLQGAAYRIPTTTLDESVIIDNITVQTRHSKREIFNGVKGVFASADDNYIASDYPAVISSEYAIEDGAPVYLDVNLPFTTDSARAQRIAKLSLLRSRQQITCSVRCNLSAITLKAGDTVMINNERFGWSSKVFEVVNYSFEAGNNGTLGILLNLVETSAAVYDWTTADEVEYVAGQPTTLASPFYVVPPSDVTVTPTTYIHDDGTARPALDISFTNNDAFATQFEIQYSKDGGTFSSFITNEENYRLEDVTVGASYTIKVRAINRLGARSDFSDGSVSATGDTTAPALPASITATGAIRSVVLDWTNPTDADFDIVNVYASQTNDSETATLITSIRGDNFTHGGIGIDETWYYWLSAEDRTGNESGLTGGVSATTRAVDTVDLSTAVSDSITIAQQYGINPVDTIVGLTGDQDDQMVFNRADNSIYRWDETASAWTNTLYTDVADGYITTNMLGANSVVASKISVTDLSAISADVGTITAGTLSNTAGNVQLDLDNARFIMEDASSVERLRIGNDGSGNYIVKVSDGTNSTALTPKLGSIIASGTININRSNSYNADGTIGEVISLGDTYDFNDLDVIISLKGYRPANWVHRWFYGTSEPDNGIYSMYRTLIGPSSTYTYYTANGTDATTGRDKYSVYTGYQGTWGSGTAMKNSMIMYDAPFAYWDKGTQTSSDEVFITAYNRIRVLNATDPVWVYDIINTMTIEYAVIAKNYQG